MLVASCDIETTGLDEVRHQILEIGLVMWDTTDLTTPVEELPTFHTYVTHSRIIGDPFALSMHPTILRRIANLEPGWQYLPADTVAWHLRDWIEKGFPQLIDKENRAKLCFTGKNFAAFDLQFLKRLEDWRYHIRANHRFLDPGTLYFTPGDVGIPDMDTCCQLADLRERRRSQDTEPGFIGEGSRSLATKHDAVGDARIVIELFRARFV